METAGYLVSAAAELTAGMKLRKYSLVVDAYRNSSSVVRYCNASVSIDRNFDMGTETGQRFINRVIQYMYRLW